MATPPWSHNCRVMATLNISQEDALKGFKMASEASSAFNKKESTTPNSTLSNLKDYVLGTGSTGLPYAYKDAQHTATSTPQEGSGPFMSWPTWSSLSTQTPWYETMGLTRMQRYIAFGLFIAAAAILFMISLFRLPLSVLFPGKFVIPFCFANLFLFISFGFLHGFGSYAKHLVSKDRWIYTAFFFGSILGTLFVTYSIGFYPITIIFTIIQCAASFSYIVSYLPGGQAGLSFIGSSLKTTIIG